MFWGFLRFGMNAHKPFSIVGIHFKTGWDSKGMAFPFGSGFPIGARVPCWQWFPKAAALPWREESNGGQRPSWQEESNETGGFVAHDLACKV